MSETCWTTLVLRTDHEQCFAPRFQCPVSCGGGDQYRQVQCVDDTLKHPAQGCEPEGKPLETRKCNKNTCPQAQRSLEFGWYFSHLQPKFSSEIPKTVSCMHLVCSSGVVLGSAFGSWTKNMLNTSKPRQLFVAAFALDRPEECRGNIMSYTVCHSLKKRGQCSSRYIQRKCCKACKPKNYSIVGSPTT